MLMILKAHRDNWLTGIRTRYKVRVMKGRVLISCLDETNELKYVKIESELERKANRIRIMVKHIF